MEPRTIGLALLQLTRVDLAGPTLLPFVIGIAATGGRPTPARWFGIVVAGLLFHAVACTVNDIADRRPDRLDPRRADRPMVSGAVSVRAASWWAAGQSAAFCGIAALLWRGSFLLLAVSLLALGIVGDAIRKHTLVPPLWDLLFGVDMAGCVVLGARSWHGTVLALAFCYGIGCTLFDTAAAGLKDLRWDRAAGVRTSATFFGARVDGLGRFQLSAAYRIWVGGVVFSALGGVAVTGFLLRATPGPVIGGSVAGLAGAILVARGLRRSEPVHTVALGSALCLLPAPILAIGRADPAALSIGLACALVVPIAVARGAASSISPPRPQRAPQRAEVSQ